MDFSTNNLAFEAEDADELQGIEAAPAPAAAKYEQCKLPHAVADDTQLTLAGFFLLGYRVRQSPEWGTDRHELAREFGFGWRTFYAAIKELAAAGYMKRTTTKRKGLKWFAREKLDFSEAPKGRRGYQRLSRTIGNLHWKGVALLTYLNSFPHGFAVTPERIAHRFNINVKTVRRLMAPLVQCGLAIADTPAGTGICGYIRRKRGQNVDIETGQNGDTVAGQNGDIPSNKEQTLAPAAAVSDGKTLTQRAPGFASAAWRKSSASATLHAGDAEKGALALEAKPKAQGKAKARQKAASKPEPREWIAVLDADGCDVIERLRRNDSNGILAEMLFRYAGLQDLAAMLDNAESTAAERYGEMLGRIARNAAVDAIIGKLCDWNTCAEKEPSTVRTWGYFTGAIQREVQLAIEETRYAA